MRALPQATIQNHSGIEIMLNILENKCTDINIVLCILFQDSEEVFI
jgi:hypothetical protein